nr:unnamed protein product [Spirometra erinaceieuropaei]
MARQDPVHGSSRTGRNPRHPRHVEETATTLEQPSRENGKCTSTTSTLLRRCHYVYASTGRIKMALQGHSEELSETTANQSGDLVQNRPAWGRKVKTGTGICEANGIAAADAKREVRKSQVPWLLSAKGQLLPTCPRCQRAFRAPIGLVGHLREQCINNLATSTSHSTNTPIITTTANSATTTTTTTTTPVTGDQTADAHPPSISRIIHPAPTLASITATIPANITTSRTPR